MAKGNPEDKRSTSYALEVSIDDSTRNYAADFDQDGWNDWEENTCGTDFEDQENTPQDTDSDGICDTRDPDDDDDGTLDFFDSCPRSVGEDWDEDGCEDGEDDDDDNDGWEDISDDCQFSNMTMVAQGIDTDSDGCYDEEDPDADGDGYSNEHDAFPLIFSQWNDTDGDGFGDDIQGFEGDSCPVAWGNSTEDRFGCIDADGDGWSNLNDVFVNDSSQHKDSDGDGYGDFSSGTDPDYCALEPGNSTVEPFLGCPDSDGDGWADLADPCPSSSSCWKGLLSNQFNPSSHATDIAALCVLSLLLLSQFRKPEEFVERPSSLALERTKQGDTILVREDAARIAQNYSPYGLDSFAGKYELRDLNLVQLKDLKEVQLKDLKVVQLKAYLKSLNLPLSGKKSDLVERLRLAAIIPEEPLEELRIAQLKQQLNALNLPTAGNKSELIGRLRSAINSGENPLEKLKVSQLKDQLKSLNLPIVGPRSELEQRLLEAINGSNG